jgi:hypothetical protein
MRTIEQAEKDCYAAWAAQPNATHGWCVHHETEFEELTEPIVNRITYIINNKSRHEITIRLDNLRPVSPASLALILQALKLYEETTAPALKLYEETTAPAWKLYEETTAPALKFYEETKAQAWKLYEETTAPAHRADVPNHTWNGKSIFKQ